MIRDDCGSRRERTSGLDAARAAAGQPRGCETESEQRQGGRFRNRLDRQRGDLEIYPVSSATAAAARELVVLVGAADRVVVEVESDAARTVGEPREIDERRH